MSKGAIVKLSIVIPVFNEEENMSLIYEELKGVLNGMRMDHEILFIDDGSTDMSLDILKDLQRRDPAVKIISFRKNFGQTAAMSAGFDYASGDVIITMDADRSPRYPPADCEDRRGL